jgi:hypothetical protein
LNSNFQADISFTIVVRFSQTVPAFGFGIKPLGHNNLAIFHKCFIIDGFATHTSKSNPIFHFCISSINSSHHTIDAHNFLSSSASVSVKTHIFDIFQLPFGSDIVDLTI